MLYDRTTPRLAPRPEVIVAGRYRLVRKLAEGGMGSVWVARHLMLDCEVALKFLHPDRGFDGDALARFTREARAAAMLGAETDYVARIFDFGVDGGTPYLAMELLPGEDLGARLDRRKRLAPFEVVPIAAQVACALRRAHARGVVHRDLKPDNVFIVCRDDEERIKLLDFGIAKLLGPGGDASAAEPQGTLHYMAPELLTGQRLDCRADLWSFAVVLYRAVVGALPFDADSLGGLVLAVCNDPAPRPSRVVPALGADLDAFFARALRRDPDQRFQHPDELARAFADAARVSWRPPPASVPPPRPDLDPTLPSTPGFSPDGVPSDMRPTLRSPHALA
jgi:serine/threonine-protein kinase